MPNESDKKLKGFEKEKGSDSAMSPQVMKKLQRDAEMMVPKLKK